MYRRYFSGVEAEFNILPGFLLWFHGANQYISSSLHLVLLVATIMRKVQGKSWTFLHEFLKMMFLSDVHWKGKPYVCDLMDNCTWQIKAFIISEIRWKSSTLSMYLNLSELFIFRVDTCDLCFVHTRGSLWKCYHYGTYRSASLASRAIHQGRTWQQNLIV